MNKLDLKVSEKFCFPYPYYGSKKEVDDWSKKYKAYLDGVSKEDFLKISYKMILFSLYFSIIILACLGITFYFNPVDDIIFLIVFTLLPFPIIVYEFISCKKQLKQIQSDKENTSKPNS